MSLLSKAIKPEQAAPSKPKVVIFGLPGVGKTWASLDFPNTLYIDSEGGANLSHYTKKLAASGGMYFGVEQGARDLSTIIDMLKELATTKHPYKTVVIDSISKPFNSEVAKEAERLQSKGIKNEYGLDRKPAVALMRKLINWIDRIDMNVILICHEKAAYKNGEQSGSTFDAYDKLEYELHLCLNIIKTGATRRALVRKTRLPEFLDGSSFEWSYQEFAKLYGEKTIESTPVQIVLATPEQVAEVKRLLDIIKLDEKEIEKWFSKAKVESWDEMSTKTIEQCITYLKNKV